MSSRIYPNGDAGKGSKLEQVRAVMPLAGVPKRLA
jgi:hypothetical protein